MTKLELYDCTLREGEQAAGASFDLNGRVKLFSKLDDFGFDFIELGWPLASQEIRDSFKLCKSVRKNAKLVAFGSTSIKADVNEDSNLRTILETKADYACIFGKSHLEHVKKQLKLTPQENLKRISDSIHFLRKNGLPVFYDAEHYFDAFKKHQQYALGTLESALEAGAERLILCDTNGGLMPVEAEAILRKTQEIFPKAKLGVHFHNDCGLSLANALVCLPYAVQIQGTINGIGERVGNLDFSEFIPVYRNKLSGNLKVKTKKLKELADFAYQVCGLEVPVSRPFVGDSAFAHKGGVHIDAVNKGASYEHMNPEDFGNKRIIVLNTLGGSAGVIAVARQFGYELDKNNPNTKEKISQLFEELGVLEKKGYQIGAIPAEQELLIQKYFGDIHTFFSLGKHRFETEKTKDEEISTFRADYLINGRGRSHILTLRGGPIDVAYKSMLRVISSKYPKISNLKIRDFHVGIAKRSSEESTVRTVVEFEDGHIFRTVGVDSNILESGVEALAKGFHYYLNKVYKSSMR
jgi:2-isopropylmalate synthase